MIQSVSRNKSINVCGKSEMADAGAKEDEQVGSTGG
jgi:hypothetical protein